VIQYLVNIIFAIDQFVSTILGGHPDDTLSQRLGRAKCSGVRWTEPFRILVDALAFVLAGETDHCVRSLSGTTSVKELWNWGGSRSDIKVEE